MLQGLSKIARRLLRDIQPRLVSSPPLARPAEEADQPSAPLERLKRVVVTDGVGRALFEEFAAHHQSERGHEETGWLLLGLRRGAEAVVLATLPAGVQRDAGLAHVRFNKAAQMVASRLLRQVERNLLVLGVVHTHPGTLRHPSSGDYRGDSVWVRQLRGQEGIFGIGTLEKDETSPAWLVERPRPHVQRQGRRRFTWFALAAGEKSYRTIPVEFTLGPDLGQGARGAWSTIERHAPAIERICRQQARVVLQAGREDEAALQLKVPLAEPGDAIEIDLIEEKVVFIVRTGGESHLVDPREPGIERALYQIMAELAERESS